MVHLLSNGDHVFYFTVLVVSSSKKDYAVSVAEQYFSYFPVSCCCRYALSFPDSMISIVSMARRSGVVVSFVFGVFFFREKNIKDKAIDLILVLIGMYFLYLGSR